MNRQEDNKGHITRFSDSSMYDEKCVKCGATDAVWDKGLNKKCPVKTMKTYVVGTK